MSKATEKHRKILKTLDRHREFYNETEGTILLNDFMQISKILELLHEKQETRAFNLLFAVLEKSLDDDIRLAERGKRIHKLSKGTTQPKGTGHKNLDGLKKER